MDDFVLGDRELDVMGVLWDIGSGTVAEVRDRLPATLAYTTVLTVLRTLEEQSAAIDKSFDYLLDRLRVNVPGFVQTLTQQK